MTAPVASKRRSALEAFGDCQYRWHAIYVRGVADDSAEARRGTSFHACAKHYIRALFTAREASNAELARHAFHAGLVEAPCPPALLDDLDALFWSWAERFELDVDAYVLNETNPNDPDGYQLRIDLAYARGDVLEMPDFKTHHAIWAEARVRRAFQAKFYCARARRIWPGFQTYRFTMDFVRFNAQVSVEFSQSDLDRVDDQVDAIEAAQADALRVGTFTATPGDHCGYCALPCPVVDQASTHPVRLLTRADAERVAGEFLALQQAIAARRQALHSYTALEGPLEVGGVTFLHERQDRRAFPAAAVVDALRAQDIEPTFSVGTTALKSLLTAKKWAHVRPAIEQLATVRPGMRFVIQQSIGVVDDETRPEQEA